MTLGERMQKLRGERRLSIGEISRNTNVRVKYLECLEEGNYSELPAKVYVKGFLKNYANFMGVSEQTLIKQYEREVKIQQNLKGEEPEVKEIQPIKFSSLIVTPKMIIITLTVIFVLSGFAYLYNQVDNFVSMPRLVIMKPLDGTTVDGRTVRVTGVAEKDSQVYINDQPILVNEKGEFSEDVGLGEGLNTITVVAKNRFDKESKQAVSVNANYQNAVASQNGPNENMNVGNFTLELHVLTNPTWISVEADGNLVYSGVLLPQSVQKFEAKDKISVTSGNGSDTRIRFQGKEEEVLNPDSGVVRDIIFTPNGRAS